MSAANTAGLKTVGDAVMENLRGGTIAQKLIFDLRGGHASPDALLETFKAIDSTDRQRGFARALQKALEGRA